MKEMNKALLNKINSNKTEYERLLKDSYYTNVRYNPKNGGLTAIHKEHHFDEKTGKYEKTVQDLFFKKGDLFTLESESSLIAGKKVDGKLNSFSHEISTIIGTGDNAIKRALNHSRQKQSDVAILYFPNKETFNMNRLRDGIRKYNGQADYRFTHIVYIVDDKIYYY